MQSALRHFCCFWVRIFTFIAVAWISFTRALYYSCVFMLESCLFSQLKVELLSLLLFHFLLFCVPICCEKSSLGGNWKKTPTFFGKSPTKFGKTPTFFEKAPTFFEEVPSIHWQSPRNAREMMQVKEVFKGHKARFYDEMEQNTAKGDKKLQISFWGIWAKNGLYSIILRSLDCKIVLSEIFLRFFL